jgi:hypothetical protein
VQGNEKLLVVTLIGHFHNIISSNPILILVHYPSIYFEVILGPMDLSLEPLIEWRVSMKKFEKNRTIEKYILIYKTKVEELIYNK